METLDLARLRAVDAALLGSASQYLPGLYVPFNAADAADLDRLRASDQLAFRTPPRRSPRKPRKCQDCPYSLPIRPRAAPWGASLGIRVNWTDQRLPQFGEPAVWRRRAVQDHSALARLDVLLAGIASEQRAAWPALPIDRQGIRHDGSRPGPDPGTKSVDGQAIANVVLENVVPVLQVAPFQTPIAVVDSQLPYQLTLPERQRGQRTAVYGAAGPIPGRKRGVHQSDGCAARGACRSPSNRATIRLPCVPPMHSRR